MTIDLDRPRAAGAPSAIPVNRGNDRRFIAGGEVNTMESTTFEWDLGSTADQQDYPVLLCTDYT